MSEDPPVQDRDRLEPLHDGADDGGPNGGTSSTRLRNRTTQKTTPALVSPTGFTTKLPESSSHRYDYSKKVSMDVDRLASGYQIAGATSVRKHLQQHDQEQAHRELVKYKPLEFLTSMLYESLPPLIGSPLLAVMLEGPTRAYHLVNHRLFLAIDLRYHSTNPNVVYVFWVSNLSPHVLSRPPAIFTLH